MASKKEDKNTVSMVLYHVPKHIAAALDTFSLRRGLGRRENAILKVVEQHPEITRIIHELRLEAGRAKLEDKRREVESGRQVLSDSGIRCSRASSQRDYQAADSRCACRVYRRF